MTRLACDIRPVTLGQDYPRAAIAELALTDREAAASLVSQCDPRDLVALIYRDCDAGAKPNDAMIAFAIRDTGAAVSAWLDDMEGGA